MKRLVPLLVLLLAVLLTLLAVFSLGSAGDDAAPGAEETEAVAGATEAPAASQPASRRRRRGGEQVGDSASEPGALEAAEEELGIEHFVRVRDARGRPVPGVRIEGAKESPDPYTGPDGVALVGRVGPGEKLNVTISGMEPSSIRLTEPMTDFTLPVTIPLTVSVVDGETGAVLSGAGLFLGLGGTRELEIPASPAGGALEVAPILATGSPWLWVRVQPPLGYANQSGGSTLVTTRVSRFAERYHVTIPVRPEASVRVVVKELDGSPATGATVSWVATPRSGLPHRSEPADEKGRIDVRGIPFLYGETVLVTAEKGGRSAKSTPAVLVRQNDVPEVEVTLPAEPNDGSFGIGGGMGGRFSSRTGHASIKDGTGRIEVTVTRRGGAPAVRAHVLLNGRRKLPTDEYGRVVFEGLGPARYVLEVREPGYVRTQTRVTLEDGATAFATLEEAEGWTGRVVVKHADGTPARFARIKIEFVSSIQFLHLVNGVQHALLYTDASGVLEIPHLGGSRVHATAEFGSRRATGVCTEKKPELELLLER